MVSGAGAMMRCGLLFRLRFLLLGTCGGRRSIQKDTVREPNMERARLGLVVYRMLADVADRTHTFVCCAV